MEQTQPLWQFMRQESGKLLQQTFEHVGLTFISLLIAIVIGLPLGIYITHRKRAAGAVLGACVWTLRSSSPSVPSGVSKLPGSIPKASQIRSRLAFLIRTPCSARRTVLDETPAADARLSKVQPPRVRPSAIALA